MAVSLERARALVRSDTWLGYHEAAALLALRATSLDPLQAGSLRALALAALALDYRDAEAANSAGSELLAQLRAERIPPSAQLAQAALDLASGKAGDAIDHAGRAGGAPLGLVLHARTALYAGHLALALESLERALSADPDLPAALALRGDLLRRDRKYGEARAAYEAALSASSAALAAGLAGNEVRAGMTAPHVRATLGLGKLALSRELPPEVAAAGLERLLRDERGSPQVERARAALLLAALQARHGDRSASAASVAAAGLPPDLHAWLERAVGQVELERGAYRPPEGAPASLLSASDDDPYVAPPPPPPRVVAPPRAALHGFKVHGKSVEKKPAKVLRKGGGTAGKKKKR